MSTFVLLSSRLFAQQGNVRDHSLEKAAYTITTDSGTIRMTFYSSDIVRFDALPGPASVIEPSLVVVQSPSAVVPVTLFETDSNIVLKTDRMRVECAKHPLRITIFSPEGKKLLEQSAGNTYAGTEQSRQLQFIIGADDHFYGTGERGTSLDKRGQRFVSYNTQIGGYSEPLGTMNLNVPFIANPNGYAVYIDNTYRGIFDFGKSDPSRWTYSAEGGELSWYVIVAPTISEQLQRYTWLTGRQPLPPRWAFGFIQSKNRYLNGKETRGIVNEMRNRKFPCDAVVLDLAWFKQMGDISWDESAWSDHNEMVNDFLKDGIKTILITEPYIIQPSRNFAEADSLGYLAKDSTGKTYFLEKWWSCDGCNSSLLDLTNPAAQQWWWKKHPSAFGSNVAGIWTDLGEPEKHPETMKHFMGSTVKIHNIFNLLWAKMIFEGFTALRPNERVMNVTRSGFAGIQRYGVMPWSGDVSRSFGGLAVQLPMLLNMGMSGIAYHNSDLGGYARNPTTPELYIRWMQYGVFCPITRAHGAGESVKGSPTEPWMFGAEAEVINRKYLELRYQLFPYNYSLAFQNFSTGMPLARPLFWLEPEDPELKNESSSYMWGDAFLVSPVVAAGQKEKEVTFPSGDWTDYWTDVRLSGGKKMVVAAPLDKVPLFVKAGSIIPMSPLMRYSDERPLDTLIVHIYPDTVNGSEHSFALYEDDGRSLEYQSGKFTVTTLAVRTERIVRQRSFTVSASPSDGSFAHQVTQRTYRFDIHNIDAAYAEVTVAGKVLPLKKNSAELRKSSKGYFYDAGTKRLNVQMTVPMREKVEFRVSVKR
ncbi:MAG: glycoside hydrolase family 31 protein [Bacteroidota bacterium]